MGSTSCDTVTDVASPWVRKFLTDNKHEKLMLVPIDFFMDPFNLAQLAPIVEQIVFRLSNRQPPCPSDVSLYKKALHLIITQHQESTTSKAMVRGKVVDNSNSVEDYGSLDVEVAAVILYCLVHQRYVLSPRGLEALRQSFQMNSSYSSNSDNENGIVDDDKRIEPIFGRCPRASCRGMPLLPAGPDDYLLVTKNLTAITTSNRRQTPGQQHVQDASCGVVRADSLRYCGQCHQYWVNWENRRRVPIPSNASLSSNVGGGFIQGCAWGLTLGPLFHLTYPQYLRPSGLMIPPPPTEPRIFGFRIDSSTNEKSNVNYN